MKGPEEVPVLSSSITSDKYKLGHISTSLPIAPLLFTVETSWHLLSEINFITHRLQHNNPPCQKNNHGSKTKQILLWKKSLLGHFVAYTDIYQCWRAEERCEVMVRSILDWFYYRAERRKEQPQSQNNEADSKTSEGQKWSATPENDRPRLLFFKHKINVIETKRADLYQKKKGQFAF